MKSILATMFLVITVSVPNMIPQPPTILKELTFQYFSHTHAQGNQFDFYVKISKVNLSSLFYEYLLASSPQNSKPIFTVSGFSDLKKTLQEFYNIWERQPPWSIDWNHFNKLSFSSLAPEQMF